MSLTPPSAQATTLLLPLESALGPDVGSGVNNAGFQDLDQTLQLSVRCIKTHTPIVFNGLTLSFALVATCVAPRFLSSHTLPVSGEVTSL
jgi:hypothetical protein